VPVWPEEGATRLGAAGADVWRQGTREKRKGNGEREGGPGEVKKRESMTSGSHANKTVEGGKTHGFER
jgi:hypothetical protein